MKRFLVLVVGLISLWSSAAYGVDQTYINQVSAALQSNPVYIDPTQTALSVNDTVNLIAAVNKASGVYVAVVPSTIASGGDEISGIAGLIGSQSGLNGVVLVISETGAVTSSNVLAQGDASTLLDTELATTPGFQGILNFIAAASDKVKIAESSATTSTVPTSNPAKFKAEPSKAKKIGSWIYLSGAGVVVLLGCMWLVRSYYDSRAQGKKPWSRK